MKGDEFSGHILSLTDSKRSFSRTSIEANEPKERDKRDS